MTAADQRRWREEHNNTQWVPRTKPGKFSRKLFSTNNHATLHYQRSAGGRMAEVHDMLMHRQAEVGTPVGFISGFRCRSPGDAVVRPVDNFWLLDIYELKPGQVVVR